MKFYKIMHYLFFISLFSTVGCDDSESAADKAMKACSGSCEAQRLGCSSLAMGKCLELCELVVALKQEQKGCLDLASAIWACDSTAKWKCSADTMIVGTLVTSSDCAAERQASDKADCP